MTHFHTDTHARAEASRALMHAILIVILPALAAAIYVICQPDWTDRLGQNFNDMTMGVISDER